MKRNLDIIRHILLTIEAHNCSSNRLGNASFITNQYDLENVSYNLKLLFDAGYIEGHEVGILPKNCHGYIIDGMNMLGHDYLDNVRDENVWKGIKDKLGSATTTASLDVIKSVGSKVILSMLGI